MVAYTRILDLKQLPPWVFVSIPLVIVAARLLIISIHRLYFDPLSKIPGPRIAAVTELYHAFLQLSGRSPFKIKELHDKYGPVVRISPTQVSFNTAKSWKDIYGHTTARKPFLKSSFYDGDGTKARTITSVRDPVEHGKMRRLLSNAFSAKALAEQEDVVHGYIDLFIKRIDERATNKPNGEDITTWYNSCTFDIIGDLAFGDPFGSLESGVMHEWISVIMDAIKSAADLGTLMKIAGNNALGLWIKRRMIPKEALDQRRKHYEMSKAKLAKRMSMTTPRKDFLSRILSEKEAQGITVDTLIGHSSSIIIAGSETTATFLSGVSYYLCRTKHAYDNLVQEIRTTFQHYNDITGQSTEHCQYLKAVIDEGLRIYPPAPIGLPRVSPGEVVDGIYIPEGAEVFTSAWAATHSEENFHEPDRFLPERWLSKENTKDKLDASQPFSLGSRVCLGRGLALLEMRLILAKMLWVFDMELKDPKLDWNRDNKSNLLWRKPPLRLSFARRQGVEVPGLDQ